MSRGYLIDQFMIQGPVHYKIEQDMIKLRLQIKGWMQYFGKDREQWIKIGLELNRLIEDFDDACKLFGYTIPLEFEILTYQFSEMLADQLFQ